MMPGTHHFKMANGKNGENKEVDQEGDNSDSMGRYRPLKWRRNEVGMSLSAQAAITKGHGQGRVGVDGRHSFMPVVKADVHDQGTGMAWSC